VWNLLRVNDSPARNFDGGAGLEPCLFAELVAESLRGECEIAVDVGSRCAFGGAGLVANELNGEVAPPGAAAEPTQIPDTGAKSHGSVSVFDSEQVTR
jgi:hypothetical protein